MNDTAIPYVRFKVSRRRNGTLGARHIVYRPNLLLAMCAPWLRFRYGALHRSHMTAT